MNTKLTLRVDDALVREAKSQAARRGKSVSMCCSTTPLLPPPPPFSRSSRNLSDFRDSAVTVLDPTVLLSTVGAAESATDARGPEEQ